MGSPGACGPSGVRGAEPLALTLPARKSNTSASVPYLLDMSAMPKGVEQQRPRGHALAAAGGGAEQGANAAGVGDFLHAGEGGHQVAKAGAVLGDPGAYRNGKALLRRGGVRLGQGAGEPVALSRYLPRPWWIFRVIGGGGRRCRRQRGRAAACGPRRRAPSGNDPVSAADRWAFTRRFRRPGRRAGECGGARLRIPPWPSFRATRACRSTIRRGRQTCRGRVCGGRRATRGGSRGGSGRSRRTVRRRPRRRSTCFTSWRARRARNQAGMMA